MPTSGIACNHVQNDPLILHENHEKIKNLCEVVHVLLDSYYIGHFIPVVLQYTVTKCNRQLLHWSLYTCKLVVQSNQM